LTERTTERKQTSQWEVIKSVQYNTDETGRSTSVIADTIRCMSPSSLQCQESELRSLICVHPISGVVG